jgi:hypothetical protein
VRCGFFIKKHQFVQKYGGILMGMELGLQGSRDGANILFKKIKEHDGATHFVTDLSVVFMHLTKDSFLSYCDTILTNEAPTTYTWIVACENIKDHAKKDVESLLYVAKWMSSKYASRLNQIQFHRPTKLIHTVLHTNWTYLSENLQNAIVIANDRTGTGTIN